MVLTLKLNKGQAEKARRFLIEKGWLNTSRVIGRTPDRYIILPLAEKANTKLLLKKFEDAKLEQKNLQLLPPKTGNLKQILKKLVPEKHLDKIIRSYDIIGDIAILEIPNQLNSLGNTIAHNLQRALPSIKTVLAKAGSVSEEFRIRPLKYLGGENKTETIHKEHGVILHLDVTKVYYSPRTSGERLRIARSVKQNEDVLVMFAGIGVYALVIAKVQPLCHVWAIEKNPVAVKFMEQNIRANRVGHIVTALEGDVRTKVPELGMAFDRIIMPYPKESENFLDLAFQFVKPKGTIHHYAFLHEDKVENHIKKIENIAKKFGKEIEIQNWFKVASYAPKVWKYAFDVLVE